MLWPGAAWLGGDVRGRLVVQELLRLMATGDGERGGGWLILRSFFPEPWDIAVVGMLMDLHAPCYVGAGVHGCLGRQ